jgi:hypothetical protein
LVVRPRRSRALEKELRDNSTLLRQWKRWHRQQLHEALHGKHGAIVGELVGFLKSMTLKSAPALIALLREPTGHP